MVTEIEHASLQKTTSDVKNGVTKRILGIPVGGSGLDKHGRPFYWGTEAEAHAHRPKIEGGMGVTVRSDLIRIGKRVAGMFIPGHPGNIA